MKSLKQFIFLSIVMTDIAFAHGENKLGPHAGYIRMPGPYHTELVPISDNTFHIYLMDVSNKNATIKDSSVKLTYTNNNKKTGLKCSPKNDFFVCKATKKINTQKGTLIINAVRLNIESSDATYDLPLKLITEDNSESKQHDMSKM